MALMRRKEAWILRKIDELRAIPEPCAREWTDGITLPLLGSTLTVDVCPRGTRARNPDRRVEIGPGTLRVHAPARGGAWPPRPATLHRLVADWYRDRALSVFSHRMAVLRRNPVIHGLGQPGTLAVQRMRRRWGSCFCDGRIHLNTELLAEPVELIDYVIVHELCHLREHNHSRRFYRLMDAARPEWRRPRDALRRSRNSAFLQRPPRGESGPEA